MTADRWPVAAMWLLCCATMLWLFHGAMPSLGFHDPDDAMRLQQVRDWVAGQPLFDISQHRVNPPLGGPMHWSRIVDLPVAALILLCRPLIGVAGAEIVACVAVPLLLLGTLTAIAHVAVRRIGGRDMALLSTMLLLTAPSILVQFTPLRIDHHGWQIMLAAFAFAGLFDPRPVRGGAVMGGAFAVWLQISSESLPYVALFAAALALFQWIRRTQAPRLVSFALTLGAVAMLLLAALHGWSAFVETHCDALSAAYIWPLAAFAVATPLACHLIGSGTGIRRFTVAAIGGGAALGVLAVTGGSCLSGDPFQSLGPVAYKFWYSQVMEGRPIWEQDLSRIGSILLPSLAGMLGTALAAYHVRADRIAQDRWLLVALLLLGATAVSIIVMRALSVAHLFSLPGIAWMILVLFRRVQASPNAAARVLGSTALVLLTPAGLCSLWIALTSAPEPLSGKTAADQCQSAASIAPLASLPPALVFAPMDIGPNILIRTGDAVIATGHHRNAAGITAVIAGFMAPPEKAHAMIGRLNGGKGVDYIVTCTDLNEFRYYAKAAPHGLAAALRQGRIPNWLSVLPTGGPLKIYKLADQPGTKAIATPFMQ